MKCAKIITVLFFILIADFQIHATDSVVQVEADQAGLTLMNPADLPRNGTFWLVLPGSPNAMAPLPCPPTNAAALPIYAMTDSGQFLVDATAGGSSMSPTALLAQAIAVSNLIVQVQTANQRFSAMDFVAPPFPGGGDGGGGYTNAFNSYVYTFNTNELWLEITNVSSGLGYLNLHNGTNQVYAIWQTTNLLTPFANWQVTTEIWPTNTNPMPFTVYASDANNLFLRAQDWTGVMTNGLYDWWVWEYFGSLNHSANDLDSQGMNTLGYDYTNNLDPNVISFLPSATNFYVNNASVSVPINLYAGAPSYYADLVNDTNFADAVWQAYTGTNLAFNLGLTNGVYNVWFGLKGFAPNATETWSLSFPFTLDTVSPVIVITNPTSSIVTQSMVKIQGYASKALESLTFDVSNASGVFTNQTGFLTGQFYDTDLLAYTTNYFACPNVALDSGSNLFVLHSADWAGNAATVSFTLIYVPDTNPPTLNVVWPLVGTSVSGSKFTLQAQVKDSTTTVAATVNGTPVQGLVEQSGVAWVKDLPLSAGTNAVTLTASNSVGGVSTTNFNVIRNDAGLATDSLTSDELNQAAVTVTGAVGDSSDRVTVNGVSASVDGSGHWEADGVPVNPVGTASLNVQVTDGGGNPLTSQSVYQPQPVTVGLMSYSGQISEAWDTIIYQGDMDSSVNWSYDSGGMVQRNQTSNDSEQAQGHNGFYLPSGISEDVMPPWEYANTPFNWLDVDYGNTYSGTLNINTHVMIQPSGQQAAGQTNLYLVLACAKGVSNPSRESDVPNFGYLIGGVDWWYGDVPLPPEDLQIQGQTLVDTGMTNTDGAVWGATLVTGAAGQNVDVTPVATQLAGYNDYTFTNQATNVTLQLAADVNRNGNITFDAQDQSTATHPYQFWVNDNHDGYGNIWNVGSVDSVQEDLDPSTGNDASSNSISCTRDLEDYTRLWMNVQGIASELQSGTFRLALQWKNVAGNPAIRIFPAAETNGGSLYLTDTNTAQLQITAPFGTNIVDEDGQQVVTSAAPFFFATNFCANMTTNPLTYLLFDGVSSGSGQLVLAIYKNDGVTKLAESQPMNLSLNEITNMYERWTVGEGNGDAPSSTATNLSASLPSPEANQYILFVHGWNMAPQDRDAFASTAYKRLWWQGYKGRFGAFHWPTTIFSLTNPRSYDAGESNAWASATGLAGLLNTLNTDYPGQVYMFAHSMGNVVAGEALKLIGASSVVNTYIACQAAVSAHGYDPTSTTWQSSGSTPDIYANYWTTGAPCYFSGVTSAGARANFYNTSDWALGKWVTDQSLKPDNAVTPAYHYVTPSGTHPSGFYRQSGSIETDLYFPTNNYEVLAYGVQSYSYTLGATASVNGFTPENLPPLWQNDPFETDPDLKFSDHPWHSAEFLFSNAEQQNFWDALLGQQGFDLK